MVDPDRHRTIREAYEAYNRGELDAVVALLDEDVELVPPPTSPEPDPLRGREAVREYMSPVMFAEQSAEPVEIIDEGDRLLIVAHVRARGRESGAEIDATVFHLWHLEGERVARFEVFMDREPALAALRGG